MSPNRASQATQRKCEYRDSRGLSLRDVRTMLGEDTSRWPKIGRPIRDRRVCEQFHALHDRCWFTGAAWPEAHHMGAGFTRGKRDELCCLVALSKAWHERVNTVELPLGTLLWLKWHHDWPHTDWLRLTLIFGYHLPELMPVDSSISPRKDSPQ